MNKKSVTFIFIPGVFGKAFEGATVMLQGSWDADGIYSDTWTASQMKPFLNDDGGTAYRAVIKLDASQEGTEFRWGASLRHADGREEWAIPTEVNDHDSMERYRSFLFNGKTGKQRYYLTHCRRMGANKYIKTDGSESVRFAVWAPNAKKVELVFGSFYDIEDPEKIPLEPDHSLERSRLAGGYIADDGAGIHPKLTPVPMKKGLDDIWETPSRHKSLEGGVKVLNHRPYMFRVTREDGSVAYRTDLYSRCQCGGGTQNPGNGEPWSGLLSELEGSVSCSVTVNPEEVTQLFEEPVWPELKFISEEKFWKNEFTDKPIPKSINDLIIYELHMGALGYPDRDNPGTLKDAIAMLDHIAAANFNAVELLPLSEFGGGAQNWGYATSHYFAIEYGGGGRDQFKNFIKECHRRGLAVIMDVVYNHYDHSAERAEWAYDSPLPEHNIYYWYEGNSKDYHYPDGRPFPEGGYIDNMSTGWSPRFWEETVRKMFISSAVMLMKEFHVDGFRMDQTTSMHSYNALHLDGRSMGNVNAFGGKFLRELGRTLRLFKPDVFLMAEDHSDWDAITKPVSEKEGMGFDARWYSMFYHHLSGDTNQSGTAKLLYNAALRSGGGPLNMDWFSGALWESGQQKVVYNESHDEAGNSDGPFFDPNYDPDDPEKEYTSHRSVVVAVNGADLSVESTRKYAEARVRFAWGMVVLSAGIPMTLFGEESGARKLFKYNAVLENKEDIVGMAADEEQGADIYRFYSDINALRLEPANDGLRSRDIDILHVHNDNRVIAFIRRGQNRSFIIVANLADTPYSNGYHIDVGDRVPSGMWKEVFNSDSASYGGDGVGNGSGTVTCVNGSINTVIPFAGFVVLSHDHNH